MNFNNPNRVAPATTQQSQIVNVQQETQLPYTETSYIPRVRQDLAYQPVTTPVYHPEQIPYTYGEPVQHIEQRVGYQQYPINHQEPATAYTLRKMCVNGCPSTVAEPTPYMKTHTDIGIRPVPYNTVHTDVIQRQGVINTGHWDVQQSYNPVTIQTPYLEQRNEQKVLRQVNNVPTVVNADVRIAKLRLINNVVKSREVNVYIDGKVALSRFAYGSASEYIPISSDENDILVTDWDTNQPLYRAKVRLSQNDYTGFIHGSIINGRPITILLLEDDNSCPAPNIVKFRFVNAGAEIEPLNIYLNDNLILSNFKYGDYTQYSVIEGGDYKIGVKGLNGKVLLNDRMMHFTNGRIYTVYSRGIDDDVQHPLTIHVLPDNNGKCY